jgi:hypothetical protein
MNDWHIRMNFCDVPLPVAAEQWDCADLRTLLGAELMPSRLSKTFLEIMKTLAWKMPVATKAVESVFSKYV